MENEDEIVMYLRTILLVFGRNPIVHEAMMAFDKDYVGQDQESNLLADSIPDQAYRRELVVANSDGEGEISWGISRRGYALLKKHNRLK